MSEIIHADIFFFITAIAVVVVGLGLAVALYYIILILNDVREISRKIRKASDELEQDFDDLRASVKNEGARVRGVFDLALDFVKRQFVRARVKKKSKRNISE